MPHTKRSPAFLEEIGEFLHALDEGDLDKLSAEKRGRLRDILEMYTTDSPCLVKASANEPIFILRAQDVTAHEFVEMWAARVRIYLANAELDEERRQEMRNKWTDALHCAAEMRDFPQRKRPD